MEDTPAEDNPAPLFDVVQEHLDAKQFHALHWEGSFQDYLEIAEANPAVCRSSWQRLLDMVEYHGYEAPTERGAPPRWRLFDDPFNRGRDLAVPRSRKFQRVDPSLHSFRIPHKRRPARALVESGECSL